MNLFANVLLAYKPNSEKRLYSFLLQNTLVDLSVLCYINIKFDHSFIKGIEFLFQNQTYKVLQILYYFVKYYS